jgi:hypothetical protein
VDFSLLFAFFWGSLCRLAVPSLRLW